VPRNRLRASARGEKTGAIPLYCDDVFEHEGRYQSFLDTALARRRTLALILLCFALFGCELVVDFDRGKIQATDAGTDAGKDDTPPDTMKKDSGKEPEPIHDSGTPTDDDAGSDAG
jgi:hypothetical protein